MSDWKPIETRPSDGEFLAWDPVANKQDVCCAIQQSIYGDLDVLPSGKVFSSRRGVIGYRPSCDAVQRDGEYGPDEDEFQGERATHWMPLPSPPAQGSPS